MLSSVTNKEQEHIAQEHIAMERKNETNHLPRACDTVSISAYKL